MAKSTKKTTAKISAPQRPKPKKMPNPHDRVFRFVLGKPKKATAFLRTHLAEPHQIPLQLDDLEIFGTNVVDPGLEETDNDLVFKVKVAGTEVYVFPALEHQSTQPQWIILRLLNLRRALDDGPG